MDTATADLNAIINGTGSEDHSAGNLEIVAKTFDTLAELNHTVSVEVCSLCDEIWNPPNMDFHRQQIMS